jgi:hypothetical protein
MSTRGGGRGIQVDSTATVDLVDLSVSTASEVGVFVVGNGTTATLTNVEVHDTSTEAGEYGYGFVFQGGASVTMSGGGAFDNHAVGILADTAIVDIDNVSVEGTVQDADGYLGRGMQLQGDVDAIVSNCALAGNHDTGIFALTAMAVSVSTTTIQATAAADMPNSGEQSGDGIVVSSGDVSYNPADFDTELTGNTIDGSTRAGIVLEGVTVSVSGNQVTGSGYDVGGVSIFAQESAVVSGSDTVENLAEGLDVNRYQISTQ